MGRPMGGQAIRLWRKALAGLAGLAALGVAAGFLGALHPVGDSFSVFRPVFAGLALASGLALRPRGPRLAVMVALTLLLGWHGWQGLRPDWQGASRLTLYQKNLYFQNDARDSLLADLRARSADIVTLQEVSNANAALLEALRADYPHQLYCPLSPNLGEVVLSRHPFVPDTSECSRRDALAIVQVAAPAGPVWIISVHLGWPWPRGQAAQVTRALPHLSSVSGPAVVAGDFNAVAWSYTVARIASATQTRRVGRQLATLRLPVTGIPIGIDHVLSTGPGRVRTLPLLGSDHAGLWAELDPWATE
ncbi:endonuclease/exonuclease/phosphatase family protein [Thetidibacter halocola]|uniref:Endonuclease/exonuclease/phosphatase family protein n=1 Tax=Thetidibacter halocola TaxID=2827239 RepID=A0A8J8B784_9RHOB|nr:endonuclease/exonuclease/phosphatase family protein [Thetidibacter halocola]MBS0124157.1 endonuclease/exonuclease/phosphatase family protein [Thetidibacter halocola]